MDFIAVVKNLGIPVGLLLAIAFWVHKSGWPWLKSIIDRAQNELKEAHQTYMKEMKEAQRTQSINAERERKELTKLLQQYDQTTNRFLDNLEERDNKFEQYMKEQANRDMDIKNALLKLSSKIEGK